MTCTLCFSDTDFFFHFKERDIHYYRCKNCRAVFMDPADFPSKEEEIYRYSTHNNDVNDIGYQKFVMPLVNKITDLFDTDSIGLDFGSGTGPVITKLLRDLKYTIHNYDPFFDNNPDLLRMKYDYIVSCEVVEHFHHPAKEFKMLHSMLKDSGALLLKTEVYTNEIDFSTWYYKNDETHVIFYHPETLNWMKSAFDFKALEIDGRHIYFRL